MVSSPDLPVPAPLFRHIGHKFFIRRFSRRGWKPGRQIKRIWTEMAWNGDRHFMTIRPPAESGERTWVKSSNFSRRQSSNGLASFGKHAQDMTASSRRTRPSARSKTPRMNSRTRLTRLARLDDGLKRSGARHRRAPGFRRSSAAAIPQVAPPG